MTITELWSELKTLLNKSPRTRSQELDFPSGYEPGLRHRHNGGHVLCRDDAVVECSAGANSSMLVDGPAQTVRLTASAVELTADTIQLQAPAGGIYFGYQRFNPYWLSGPDPAELDPLVFLKKAPLTLTNPLDLGTTMVLTAIGPPSPTLVAQGVIPRPLASLFTPIPLFAPNEQLLLLSDNLGEMLSSLGEHMAGLE